MKAGPAWVYIVARTAINVYSVRELDDSVTELIHRVADNGYDGIQFSGNHTPFNGDPESIRVALDETELGTPPAHVSIDALEGDLDRRSTDRP